MRNETQVLMDSFREKVATNDRNLSPAMLDSLAEHMLNEVMAKLPTEHGDEDGLALGLMFGSMLTKELADMVESVAMIQPQSKDPGYQAGTTDALRVLTVAMQGVIHGVLSGVERWEGVD